jgi:hypothetical protein
MAAGQSRAVGGGRGAWRGRASSGARGQPPAHHRHIGRRCEYLRLALVHKHGPQCADTTAAVRKENAAGQGFLIGDASLGWNPGPPATLALNLIFQ